MNKKITLILIFMSTLFCISCSNNKKNESVSYLNDNNSALFLLNIEIENKYELNNFIAINTLGDIKDSYMYHCILIDVEKQRVNLNKAFIDSLHDLLESSNKYMIIFYGGQNYNFFKDTEFANEKDYYYNVSQNYSYDNFRGSIKIRGSNTNINTYFSSIMHYSSLLKEYIGEL